jgi:hypothetical protein
MQADDGSYANTFWDAANVKQYNFSFSIPGGADIDGIEVRAEAYKAIGSGTITFDFKTYYNSRATAAPDTKVSSGINTSDTVVTVGGASDLWGRSSWSDTDFTNANFAVYIESNIPWGTVYVDYVQAKIYYTEVGWGHKLNTITNANIGKVNTISKASIGKINGIS